MTDSATNLPEGWYQDPSNRKQFRWWTGEAWTGYTARTPDAAHPASALGAETRRRRDRRSMIFSVGAAGATLITAVTLVIPFVFDATQRQSGADTLEIDDREGVAVAPAPADAAAAVAAYDDLDFSGDNNGNSDNAWRTGLIPFDAPFADMPVDTGNQGCSAAQNAWLAQHGVHSDTRADVDDKPHILVAGTLRNNATIGGAVSLRNLRVEGEFSTPAPRFSISCQEGGRGEGVPPIWTTAVLGDPSPAVYMENPQESGMGVSSTPPDLIGTPFTENLDPGEYSQLFLLLSGIDDTKDFTGRVVTDVIDGTETFEAVLKEGQLQTALPQITTLHVFIGRGGVFCFPDGTWINEANFGYPEPDLSPFACTPQDLAARAGAAAAELAGRE